MGNKEDEVSFPEDASIVILKREGEWWTGMTEDGSTGIFVSLVFLC